KNYTILIILYIAILIPACKKDDPIKGTQYRVTFSFYWDSQNFPTDFPSNAHFSKLIGWSHDSTSTFFKVGTMASGGIQKMAESGSVSPLDFEINNRVSSGEGFQLVVGDNLSSGTGNITVLINVDEKHPSVTLATMVAPSPDWYVAVVNINLLKNGQFINEKTMSAHVYDSGTDNGTTFKSANSVTNPKQPISIFVSSPLGNDTTITPDFATVKFTKL
ncbi:spondin domain-containing protein, partial [Bacteroidota bacterium]